MKINMALCVLCSWPTALVVDLHQRKVHFKQLQGNLQDNGDIIHYHLFKCKIKGNNGYIVAHNKFLSS